MLNTDIIANFIGLRNVTIDKIREKTNFIKFHTSTSKSKQICPCCGKETSGVHDYRKQTVKHSVFRGKQLLLVLNKRRYVYSNCNKRFYEKYSFLPKYYHISNSMFAEIIERLHRKISLKDIAEEFKVSTNTVARAFKLVSFTNKPKLPTTLGIDEFKGNTGGEKYNVILTNLENFKITDILPSRKKSDLISYFMRYSRKERNNVKVLVMDMHSNYKEIRWLFPSVEIVAN